MKMNIVFFNGEIKCERKLRKVLTMPLLLLHVTLLVTLLALIYSCIDVVKCNYNTDI